MNYEKKSKSKTLLLRFSCLFVLSLLSISSFSQQITQTGTIKDKDSEPIIGVTIVEKGAKGGSVSDVNGNFSINCQKGATLTFTYMGYETITLKATGTKMDITMKEDIHGLDEVVVIGYGTLAKKHISGSMNSVTADQIEEKNAVSLLDALQGVAPGMQIVSNSGAPGEGSFVSIRGASTFSDDGVVRYTS